ncbi:MAG: hypothetical protein IT507_18670 [Burkholderiaceae bacterium]|nr:hypothetical protein [Burkholderiaceae bacterium]
MGLASSPPLPSERRFGALFTIVFSLAGIYGHFVKDWSSGVVIGLFAASLVVALVSLVAPALLAPFNKAWFKLGLLLGKIVSPIVLGLIFFVLLTPVGVIGRLLGRDELRLKKAPVTSWWIDRNPPGPAPDSFKNQF